MTWWGADRYCGVLTHRQFILKCEVWLWLVVKELIVLDTETHCGWHPNQAQAMGNRAQNTVEAEEDALML